MKYSKDHVDEKIEKSLITVEPRTLQLCGDYNNIQKGWYISPIYENILQI